MTSIPNKYRYIDFIGGNILDASNVTLLQAITEGGVASGDVAVPIPGLAQLYQPGTLLNAVFNITGSSITFTQANVSYPVYVLVNDRFESLGNTVIIGPTTQPVSGTHNLYLNWSWDIKTSSDDASFIDGITGEPTIEAGQLSLVVDWTDTSGTALNPVTQFAKNTSPIVLAIFNLSATPNVTVTYINGIYPYAEGNPNQAGLVALTDNSGTAVGSTDPRMSDARVPEPGSVFSSSVAKLIQTGVRSSYLPSWVPGLAAPGAKVVDSNGNLQTCIGTVVLAAFALPYLPAHIPALYVTDLLADDITGLSFGWSVVVGNLTLQAISNNPPYSSLAWGWRNGGPAGTPAYDPTASFTYNFTSVTVTGNSATYVGSFAGGNLDLLAGYRFNISGFANPGNNGFEMLCVSSIAGALTFINPYGVTEVHAGVGLLYQGGISSDDIIYKTQQESLTAYLDGLAAAVAGGGTVTSVFGRTGAVVAQSGDYTASQVGAAPASHVGQALGLGTSHPASVTSDTGGFSVQEATGSVSGDAYTLSSSTSVRKAAITHSGDLFSLLANAANAQGLNGNGGPATYRGTLGLVALIANVLAEHVNYHSHGNNNPHGLNSADIGAASETYVNNTVAGIIADVMAYTDAKTNISVRTVTTTGAAGIANSSWDWGGVQPSNNTITYFIVNIGGYFEMAIGFGQYQHSNQVALPEAAGWSSGNWLGLASCLAMSATEQGGGAAMRTIVALNVASRIVTAQAYDSSDRHSFPCWASILALGWRNLTAAALIVSSFDTTANTFNQGSVGDTVQITGRNFGASGTVLFNGHSASIGGYSSTSIVCTIPAGATTGLITVTPTAGAPSNSPFVFTIV